MKTQSNIPFPTTKQKWNKHQTVTYVNQTSFIQVDEEGIEQTIYEAEILIEGDMPTIEQKPSHKPAYALLTFGQYFKFNHDLSIAKGYDLSKGTQRVLPMNPPAAKVNIQFDAEGNETGYEVLRVAEISSETQMDYPELIVGLELTSTYTPVDEEINEIIATGLNAETVDWALMHYLKVGKKDENIFLWLEDEARTSLSDAAVELLNEAGITVITVEA